MPVTAKSIFLDALDCEPTVRGAFVQTACGGNTELLRRVEELLALHEEPDAILDHPAVQHLVVPDTASLDFLAPTSKPDSLGRLDHYEVLEVIGQGGMGIVVRAFDEKLHRMVAIKVLNKGLAASTQDRQRFVKEARAAAAVTHDHVISIYAVEDDGAVPYLVMQHIRGRTLQQKLEAGPVDVVEILRIGSQLAEGLAAAHACGLIHRDIKPANILLENGIERVKITDFGLARGVDELEHASAVHGTPSYMSPEQTLGSKLDHRSDLFSLGSVLYALATGKSPFQGDSLPGLLHQIRETHPRRPQEINPAIPAPLEAVIMRLLAKNPEDRPASAEQLASELRRQLSALQGGVAPPVRRGRHILAMAIGACVILAAPIIWLTAQPGSPEPSKQLAAPTEPPVIQAARTLTGHTSDVLVVKVSPDGKTLASAGRDRKIRLWDTNSWTAREIATKHPGDIVGLAFSPDGMKLASISRAQDSCRVRLWDVATGREAGTVGSDGPGLWGVVWLHDGGTLVTGGWDRELRLWDAETGAERRIIRNASERLIRCVDISPDGSRLINGGGGKTHLWDVRTGEAIPTEFPPEFCPSFLGGDAVAGWMFHEGRVTVCEAATGKVRHSWRAHPNQIEGLATSADGRFVASLGREGIVKIWTPQGDEIATLTGHRGAVYFAAFSPDGTWLATAGQQDATVRIWKLPSVCHASR